MLTYHLASWQKNVDLSCLKKEHRLDMFSPIWRATAIITIGYTEKRHNTCLVKFRFADLAVEDAFISTAVKHAPYFQLSVSTYRGCCTLTSSLYGTEEDRKIVDNLLSQVEIELNIGRRQSSVCLT